MVDCNDNFTSRDVSLPVAVQGDGIVSLTAAMQQQCVLVGTTSGWCVVLSFSAADEVQCVSAFRAHKGRVLYLSLYAMDTREMRLLVTCAQGECLKFWSVNESGSAVLLAEKSLERQVQPSKASKFGASCVFAGDMREGISVCGDSHGAVWLFALPIAPATSLIRAITASNCGGLMLADVHHDERVTAVAIIQVKPEQISFCSVGRDGYHARFNVSVTHTGSLMTECVSRGALCEGSVEALVSPTNALVVREASLALMNTSLHTEVSAVLFDDTAH
jgi:hypothetical protein